MIKITKSVAFSVDGIAIYPIVHQNQLEDPQTANSVGAFIEEMGKTLAHGSNNQNQLIAIMQNLLGNSF